MAGAVGRPSIPSNVHYLGGNPSKKATADLLGEFRPDVELPACPKHMRDEARREYARIGKELERYGLVSKLDRGVLAMCASEWARWVWAEQRISELNAKDPAGEAGLIDRTPNDYKVLSVYSIHSKAASERYLKLCNELGLTPAARSKVKAAPQSPQLGLPGIGDGGDSGPTLRSFAA